MTTQEKVDYFDKDTTINGIELEVKLIEKMKTSELENYFKEINNNAINNNLEKDVNDRLKAIITTNSNNITRIHKKLNNLAGGVKKISGGSTNLHCDTYQNINITYDGTKFSVSNDDPSNFKLNDFNNDDIIYFNTEITGTSNLQEFELVKIYFEDSSDKSKFKLKNIANDETLTFTTIPADSPITIYKLDNYAPTSDNNDKLLLNNYNNMSLKELHLI